MGAGGWRTESREHIWIMEDSAKIMEDSTKEMAMAGEGGKRSCGAAPTAQGLENKERLCCPRFRRSPNSSRRGLGWRHEPLQSCVAHAVSNYEVLEDQLTRTPRPHDTDPPRTSFGHSAVRPDKQSIRIF